MNNAAPDPTSSEKRNIMISMRGYLEAHSKVEMNNKMDDIEQFNGKEGSARKTSESQKSYEFKSGKQGERATRTHAIEPFLLCYLEASNAPQAVSSLVVRASDSRPEGLGSMPDATKYPPSTHGFHAEIVEVEIGGVAIYRPFGEFPLAKSYCHLYGAQGERQAYI
ncbi:hypothetical protein TNCV_3294301 [Trichonephila clavipes]|nr:hypothetical protein TNCV_3294301 [Trichonephila clavipes]